MNVLMLPRADACSSATPTSTPTRPPSSWPRSPCWRPRRCAASASSRAWRCCRIRASARPSTPRPRKMREALALIQRAGARARGRGRDARRRRAQQAHAATRCLPGLAPHGRGQPADDAQPRRRQHHLQRAEDRRPARASRSGPILLGAAKPVHILTPDQHGAPHGQHDRAHRRRRRRPASGLSQRGRQFDGSTHASPPARRRSTGPGTGISTSRSCAPSSWASCSAISTRASARR